MTQSIFEIRQQAEELLREAVAIWRQSSQNDMLEGIESDPVFSLLLTALAYQLNDIDYDIERLKEEVLEEFTNRLVPYDMVHAQPATAVIATNLQAGMAALNADERLTFRLGDSFRFVPLLSTRILAAEVASVVRLDARRWKMRLTFQSPVSDISGFTFAITNPDFTDVKVTIDGKLVPLYKPWHYADLPLCRSFAADTLLYNSIPTYNATNVWLDLFARQNVRMFSIKRHDPSAFITYDTDVIEMVFEFSGIGDTFTFDKSAIALNAMLLVNAVPHAVDLSADSPIACVAGYGTPTAADNGEQFMHLTRPDDDQLFKSLTVDVRAVAADRFNSGCLLKLLNCLVNKFSTDYYAFAQLRRQYKDNVIQQVRDGLQKLQRACSESPQVNIAGTYLMLRQEETAGNKNTSLRVNYLTTNGASVNAQLSDSAVFSLPSGLDSTMTRIIAPPVAGTDEISDRKRLGSVARYFLATRDRVVTPADMKLFCYNELMTRYSIVPDMVTAVSVRTRLSDSMKGFGYATHIDILLCDTPFIRRHFTEKISQAELFIQKMITVRSTTVYPIVVSIRIDDAEA